MLKIFRTLLCVVLVSIAGTVAAQNDTLRVLAIGNSFSVDGVEYLKDIAAAQGKALVVGNAQIGGCSLDRHLREAEGGNPVYSFSLDRGAVRKVRKSATLRSCLEQEPWDYVFLQQQSLLAGQYDSYRPYIDSLMSYVRRHVPTGDKVRFGFQQTWAYAEDHTDKFYSLYRHDQMRMYGAIARAVSRACRELKIRTVVPSGTAIQNGRSCLGDVFNRDGYHLDKTLGRYTAACAWFETLFGEPVKEGGFVPAGLDHDKAAVAREAAHRAVARPYKVSDMGDCVTKR